MAYRQIRARQTTAQRLTVQQITLDGVTLQARLRYAAVTDAWYLDLMDTQGTAIVSGLAVVPGVDLLKPYKHLGLPQGVLFAHVQDGAAPSLETMDATARLLYREA